MKKIVKKLLNELGIEINRLDKRIVSLASKKKNHGNVLISYIIDPFLIKNGANISNAHHHDWLTWQMANTFLELGYNVDVIHYTNQTFIPQKDYSFFVGVRTNFQRIAEPLNHDCIKILHLDTAHWLFNNSASYKRCLALQKRKGVTIKSFKCVEPNWAIEYADYATTNLGNQFNVSTYQYAQKPIFQIPLPTITTYPWQEHKNFEKCCKHYLWFGSAGLVHKGLDLVLDAFVEMPDCHLTVCGPIRTNGRMTVTGPVREERDFEKAYFKELYQTPNIHTVGWIDVESNKFTDITNNCIGVIFPSCSEGGGASVITCMQAGLIPIVSYESNVEVKNFGIILKDCSKKEIKKSIQTVSNYSIEKIKHNAKRTWEFCRENHTKQNFALQYKNIINKIIENHK
jgi:glycosyltransferase involved in cell wall biosynthesis